jgi:hypothetical protein
VQNLFVEGGAGAAGLLRAIWWIAILLYRAPIVIGGGRPSIGDIGLTRLAMPMTAGTRSIVASSAKTRSTFTRQTHVHRHSHRHRHHPQATGRRPDRHHHLPLDPEGIAIGASIACSGVCLTWWTRAVSRATRGLPSTSRAKHWPHRAGRWVEGATLNLEPR